MNNRPCRTFSWADPLSDRSGAAIPFGSTPGMTPAEIERRRRQLAAEWFDVEAQLQRLAELHTTGSDESPADMEARLLCDLDSLEYELGCIYFLDRDSRQPK